MFDRFVRLAQARRALKHRQFEEALRLVDDPLIRDHRKGRRLHEQILEGLLHRARDRQDMDLIPAAIADVDLVIRRAPDADGAERLRDELRATLDNREAAAVERRDVLADARRCLDNGDPEAASVMLEAEEGEAAARMRRQIVTKREGASVRVRSAREALEDADCESARVALDQALAIDRGCPELPDVERELVEVAAARMLARLRDVDANDVQSRDGLLLEYEGLLRIAPDLAARRDVSDRISRLAKRSARGSVIDALRRGEWSEALEALDHQTDSASEAALRAFGCSTGEFRSVEDQRRRGELVAAAEAISGIATRLESKPLAKFADSEAKRAAEIRETFQQARRLASSGDLVGARSSLLDLLERAPLHEGVRRELSILDEGVRDREERLATARLAAEELRLREASVAALALAVPGHQGDEARALLRAVQARTNTVETGVEQVLAAVHGRVSGSIEGLEHSAARLEELTALQVDHDELNRLRAAVRAEIDGLKALDRTGVAIEAGDVPAMESALADHRELKSQFLAPGRLDARFLELADAGLRQLDGHRAAGRLDIAMQTAELLATHTNGSNAKLAERIRKVSAELATSSQEVDRLVREGLAAIDARDLDSASDYLHRAKDLWVTGGPTRTLENAISTIRNTEHRLAGVERLADSEDVPGARSELDQLGPTQAMFRTRIFDLKTSLARAQGLDHAFLLRVDEGGELLVVRGETISIGNLRDGGADLPILADLAGRHARIRRTLSFHGGMQDRMEPDQGEVTCDDEPVGRSVNLRHGHKLRFGRSFALDYRVPSGRSLTSMLTLRGHTVAGTDKILLLKDRGRDGRILIGAGDDVHVRVPKLEGEIEVFANKTGQIRIRYPGSGTMDGRPFTGEEPVTAGSVVSCGGVSLTLIPWTRG